MKRLKLAPHIHTSYSDDSEWEIGRLAMVLKRAGFDGALICDHDRTMDDAKWDRLQAACDAIGDPSGFILVPGIEYQDPDHVVHLPVFGRVPFYGRSPQTSDLVQRASKDGAAAVFAHPRRRDAWRRFDPAWARHLAGIEVWNRKYDGIRPNEWALRQAASLGLPAAVALDWHGPRQLYPLALHVSDPGFGTNAERGSRVVSSLLAGETAATAFGLDVTRFDHGVLGRTTRGVESLRRWSAPKIRSIERFAGGKSR